MTTVAENREAWLQDLTARMRPWFEAEGAEVPPVRIGVGFTSKGARSTRIGECWNPAAVSDGVVEIFIHPRLLDPVTVGATLLHELAHAAVGTEAKHGPKFKRLATKLGLTGRMTATTAGPELTERLLAETRFMGPYPHGALVPGGERSTGPKQTTRMVKVECPVDGYTVRTTRKWLDVGAPQCPAGHDMVEAA